jgi:thioesterase domain-containing protein
LLELLGDHLKQIHAWHRRPVSLVGWSFGGIYARELAAKNPELVRQVITLATPIVDKSDATHAGWLLNMLTSGISRLNAPPMERPAVPPSVPCTSVYSKTDGVVAWQACLLTNSRSHRNIEVEDVSHIGMVHHPEVLRVVAGLLADHLDGSRPPV